MLSSYVRFIASLTMVAGALLVGASASATSDPLTISVSPSRLEFVGDSEPQEVLITLRNGRPGTVLLEPHDAIVMPDGTWRDAEYGSTPSSLQGAMSIEPTSFHYDPRDGGQSFRFLVTVDSAQISMPRFGALSGYLDPDPVSGEGVTIVSSVGVALRIIAAPSATQLERLPSTEFSLQLKDLKVRQVAPWTFIDRAMPALPGLINHGPVTVRALTENSGSTVLDARVRYEFFRLTPLSAVGLASEGPPIYTITNPQQFLFPGELFDDQTTSVVAATGLTQVDALPLVGIVRVRATATGSLSGIDAQPTSEVITFVVFPWKESLFLFVVWLFQREWRHRKGRKVHVGDAPPAPTLRTRIREWLRRVAPSRPSAGE